MQESPHYKYLENENNIYEKYLINSWTEYYKIPTNKIKDKIKNYTDLKVNIKKTRKNIVPVKLVRDLIIFILFGMVITEYVFAFMRKYH